MEIKHTIEILTKDIQDIEKLVRNLNNYPSPPQIELDLALSKLRQVYELLFMISTDNKNEQAGIHGSEEMEQMETNAQTENDLNEIETEEAREETLNLNTVKQVAIEPIEDASVENNLEVKAADSKAIEVEKPKASPLKAAETEKEAIEESAIERTEEQPVEEEAVSEMSAKEEFPQEEAEMPKLFNTPKEASILAEKFESDKSLNEKIAPSKQIDLSSKIKGGPIDSIKRNIGINDRFLIIRELMNGDNEGFNQMIQNLDSCTNFNDSFKLIQTRFPEHLEHEGVKILIHLSRRKFISSGNV